MSYKDPHVIAVRNGSSHIVGVAYVCADLEAAFAKLESGTCKELPEPFTYQILGTGEMNDTTLESYAELDRFSKTCWVCETG